MAKEIQLTQGQVAIVDDDIYDYLNQWKWYANKLKGKYYAVRNLRINKKYAGCLLMHRVIMNPIKGFVVDHVNGLPLDNRKENLRICTAAENNRNQKQRINNKSGYKGVHWKKLKNKWYSEIKYKNKSIHLGCFINIIDAARAYNEAAIKYHGEFANINKID
jgi:hypothetical protein